MMQRMPHTPFSLLIALGIALLLLKLPGCGQEEAPPVPPPHRPTPYALQYPAYFPLLQIPADNPLTQEGVALGRRLYYEPKLSAGGPLAGNSCSSCHKQEASFTINSGGLAVLPHINLAWSNHFLWNGKIAGSLEEVMRFEVEDFFQTDVALLQQDAAYPALYKAAFGSETITTTTTAYALAQFFRSLVSADSKYDRYLRGEAEFTAAELRGLELFFSETGDCFHCHTTPLMTDNRFHNIGLDADFSGANLGRYTLTGDPWDKGVFKTPTLRNSTLTAPYMHDGRFQTLEEVIDFYSEGVQLSPSLDPIMTKPGRTHQLQLSQQEKEDLLAYLKTLTDDTFIRNPAHSTPF
jgi:cytochrome c peroxidase